MRTYKTEKTEISRNIITELKCDCCGILSKNPANEWDKSWGHKIDTELRITHSYYPDDGHTSSVDLCAECTEWLIENILKGKIKRD